MHRHKTNHDARKLAVFRESCTELTTNLSHQSCVRTAYMWVITILLWLQLLWYKIRHTTVLIIYPVILQTIIIVQQSATDPQFGKGVHQGYWTEVSWWGPRTKPQQYETCGTKSPRSRQFSANYTTTRMWANAQRDGRPAEHRWRPQFNDAKFSWRPLLDAAVLRSACSWWVTTYVGKPSATGLPTRPTQPFILSRSINE